MEGYLVALDAANIAPTAANRTETPEVFGQPRMTKGHPNTYWDQADIDHYKEMLKTSKELQIRFSEIKDAMDKRIAERIDIPPPQQGADGKWLFPGEYFPASPGAADNSPRGRFKHRFSRDSDDVSDLGTIYALTGEAKYAEYARKLLLAYANCSKFGAGPLYNLRSAIGLYGQLLEEALIMDHWARGYDLIYNLPFWTKENRTQLHDELFYPMAAVCLYPAGPDHPEGQYFASQTNNRGALGIVSVLMAGYATDDQELINSALYGVRPTITKVDRDRLKQFPSPKDWVACTADKPTYGLLNRYFAPDCIPGGMWVEPSVGYAFYALGSMVGAAEACWHHGIDLYRHNNAIFKSMFDFPILLSYPDLSEPGQGGSHRDLLCQGYAPTLYEYAYRRYRDPRYLAIINNPQEREFLKTFDPKIKNAVRYFNLTRVGSAPPSLLFDLDPKEGTAMLPRPSVNFELVGLGVLRTQSASGDHGYQQNLTLTAGPTASKAKPDKLQIDLFALNDVLMPSPGIVFPYNDPLLPKWYLTTLAHNTLTVDEKIQDYRGSSYASKAKAEQVVFAPGGTLGLQRAWTDSVYSGVTMDRAVFMTSEYFADIFGVFSKMPHKYDLAWHIRGEMNSNLQFVPLTFSAPVANGYNMLTNVREAVADQAWSMTLTRGDHRARLHAASAPAAQVVVGDGGLFYDKLVDGRKSTAPTILERRDKASSTVYGNALDYSDSKEGFVKGVEQEGGLEAGYGLLKVQTVQGTDLCFAAYRPGAYKTGGLETDSLQAFVQMEGSKVQAMYLAGGKLLKAGDASMTRSPSGLAYVEKTPEGTYVIGNPSPADATVVVTLPALESLALDDKDGKSPAAKVTMKGDVVTLQLKAGASVVLVKR